MEFVVTPTLSLATQNLITACSALLNSQPSSVLILSSKAALRSAFYERLCFSLGADRVTAWEEMPPLTVSGLWNISPFSLVCVQPVDEYKYSIVPILRSPNLKQLAILRSSRLAHKIFPEWAGSNDMRVLKSADIKRELSTGGTWYYRDYAIGGILSTAFGILAGRFSTGNRPELADKCNAIMRRYLYPVHGKAALFSLVMTVAVREDRCR